MTEAKNDANEEYRLDTSVPGGLTPADLQRCAAIIIEGDAIERPESVREWLPRSIALAVVRKVKRSSRWVPSSPRGGAMLSGSPRRAGSRYLRTLPSSATSRATPTHKNNRFAPRIIAALLERHTSGPLWATTSSPAIKAALADAGFRHEGKEWETPRGRLSLWVKQ
jgi:hypothetical protein